LRHDIDGGKARAAFADSGANADLSLDQAIGATFAGAVKEEDDGPFLVGRTILRQENLLLVSGIMWGKRAIRGNRYQACAQMRRKRRPGTRLLRRKRGNDKRSRQPPKKEVELILESGARKFPGSAASGHKSQRYIEGGTSLVSRGMW
jgi:hypothetical protein